MGYPAFRAARIPVLSPVRRTLLCPPASRSRAHCSPPATCPHVLCPGVPACLVFVMCLSCVRCEIIRAGQHRATVPVCWPLPASRATRHPCRSHACRLHCLPLLTCPLISSDQSCALPCPLASRLAFFPYLTLSHLLSHSYQYRHTYSCGHDVRESDRRAEP